MKWFPALLGMALAVVGAIALVLFTAGAPWLDPFRFAPVTAFVGLVGGLVLLLVGHRAGMAR